MNKLFILLALITVNCFANETEHISSGSWEGYKQMGSTYQAFALTIETNGNGFHAFIPDIKKPSPVCFPVTKESMSFLNGYFQQTGKKNGLNLFY